MKHTKKLLTAVILLFATVVLVSCKKDAAKAPVITGAGNVTVELGALFDPKKDVKATDEKDGDLTSKIVITGDTVNTDELGVYTLVYTVKNSLDLETKVTRVVTVVDAKLYAEGLYNYKFENSELRNRFFGAAENYLLENVYGGVPLFVNSGMSIYSSRVDLPTDAYVPVMGWGSEFGTLTQDDSNVVFAHNNQKGNANEYTYRGAFSSNPTTFNQWISDDSVSSDALSFMIDSLYSFEFNSDNTAYEVKPSMAKALPTAHDPKMQGVHEVSKKWTVPIKEGLEFKFPAAVGTKYNTTKNITAQTFVDTYKHAIDNDWFRAIAGGSHFWSTSTPIKGAKAYYDSENGNWDNVGIQVSADGKALEFEFDIELSEWNLVYWLSSNTLTPVHLGMVNDFGTSYGTKPENTAYTGAYYLDAYEPDKSLRYKKNDKFHTQGKYNYTGYNFTIIERAEIIFAEFEAGKLDVAGIPLTKYEQYKNNDAVKRSPGATTFRMNINGLGTKENQEAQFPGSKHTPSPILAEKDFRKALYFGVDRKTLAYDVLKTSDPGMFLFSNAYLVDADSGTAFRDTDQGREIEEAFGGDTYGYAPDTAVKLFERAVAKVVADGTVKAGTAANPTVIKLEVAVQAASTAQAQLGQFVKNSYEKLFRDTKHHVKLEIDVVAVPFPDIYYTKQLVGEFDLGMGGISGSSLDAASFLEVFTSDNRGGFTLNWGFDTSIANIPVTYTKPGETDEITEYWSFDAIVSVLNGPITVARGEEVIDSVKVNQIIAQINALPTVENLKLTDRPAVTAAWNAALSLTPKAQDAVTNLDKLIAVKGKMDDLVGTDIGAKIDAAVNALPKLVTVADQAKVDAIIELYGTLASNMKTKADLEAYFGAYAGLIDALIGALPATLTETNAGDIAEIQAYIKAFKESVGKVNVKITKETEFITKLNGKRVSDLIVAIDKLDALVRGTNGDGVIKDLTYKFDISDLRKEFKSLPETNQEAVTNIAKLVALETEIQEFLDDESALDFDYMIAGLPDPAEIEDLHLVLVENAINAYKGLTDGAKGKVKAESKAKLDKAAEALDLESPIV